MVAERPTPRESVQPVVALGLARALSKLGVCSRRQAERLIKAGAVEVDGRVVRRPQQRIDPGRQVIRANGRPVAARLERVVLAFHKPAGSITTRIDPGGRPTIYDLLEDVGQWVFPVGRLDRDSSGLLILTNDPGLNQRLTAPVHGVPKTYHVRVDTIPDAAALAVLREGVPLTSGGLTRPAEVAPLGTDHAAGTWLEIVLREGRNRQIRRMCAAVGLEVLRLVRVRIGAVCLGELPPGAWSRLEARAVRLLESADPAETRVCA